MLNHVNHEAAHAMIQALSLTEAGSDLVKALEGIRYYHKAADVYDLGYGGILVEAFDEGSDGDFYWEGSVLIPSQRDRLIYESAAYQDEPVQGALFWGWGYGDDGSGCIVIPRVLGEWAAQCAIEHATKMKTVHSPPPSAAPWHALSILSHRWQSRHLWIRSTCLVSPRINGHVERLARLMWSAETRSTISRRSSCRVTSRTVQQCTA